MGQVVGIERCYIYSHGLTKWINYSYFNLCYLPREICLLKFFQTVFRCIIFNWAFSEGGVGRHVDFNTTDERSCFYRSVNKKRFRTFALEDGSFVIRVICVIWTVSYGWRFQIRRSFVMTWRAESFDLYLSTKTVQPSGFQNWCKTGRESNGQNGEWECVKDERGVKVAPVKGKVVVLNYLSTLPWRHMGEWRYRSTFLDLGARWRWVVSFPRYPLNRRLGGPRSRSGPCGEENNFALPGVFN
jgi:hypothetical protein